jgi:hypothetical protein
MEKFKELQAIWNQQAIIQPKLDIEEIKTKSFQKIKAQKVKHFWTIGILSTLIFVLILFYKLIYNDEITSKIKGLELMIFVIVIRIILEIVSTMLFQKIDFNTSFKDHTDQLVTYFKFRKTLHFIFTPIIYLLYIVGFYLLLPLFKTNLSHGFYLYVIVSGIVFLTLFSLQLFKIIRKDLNDLKFLQNADKK